MFEQKTGFWVVDQRPKETGQMMLTEEMRTELSSLKKKELKNFVVFGPRGIGKTLFCQAVSGFKGSVIKQVENETNLIPNGIEPLILKGVDQLVTSQTEPILDTNQKVFIVAQDEIPDWLDKSKSFHTVQLNELMPKSQNSLKRIKHFLINLLQRNQINFQTSDLQFQLNIEELFDKLWPNMRQIVRQTQMRSKTGEWVSIPV